MQPTTHCQVCKQHMTYRLTRLGNKRCDGCRSIIIAGKRDNVLTPREINELKLKHPKCRAKLSDRQAAALNAEGKRQLAKYFINRMRKVHGSSHTGSDFEYIEVKDGKIRLDKGDGPKWYWITDSGSINYVICGAILKGIIEGQYGLTRLPNLEIEVGANTTHQPTPEPEPKPEPVAYIFDEDEAIEPVDLSNAQPATPPKPLDKYEAFLKRMHELRDYCNSGQHSDNISTGAIANGFKMLKHGFTQEAILHALTINWPDTVRANNSIVDYDPATYGDPPEGYHKLAMYVAALCEIRIPTLLVGPTQSGKSTLAESVSKILEIEYGGAAPLTGGASPSWLLGRDTRNGFLPAAFIQAYTEGKVFLLDEMDAADSNMLIVLNNAITNHHFDHPFLGRLEKHENFVLIAAANTWGPGATRDYAGRSKLDGATLERFRLGRVMLDYDRDLERKIMAGYQENDNE